MALVFLKRCQVLVVIALIKLAGQPYSGHDVNPLLRKQWLLIIARIIHVKARSVKRISVATFVTRLW
ncbi:hypothetical protein OAA98_02705, partial [Porticoccaceae bacterium]|nr:hypothetical protein [Porticoccaceae bacterium]